MITTDLTTLKINKLTKAQYEAALAAGNINENELYMTPESESEGSALPSVTVDDAGKVLMVNDSGSWAAAVIKPTITTTILLASNWDSTAKTYSFETDYPNASYDIEIALDSTATSEQAEAFNGAQIAGSATSNVVKAYGIVPTVDIPVIVKVVTK